MNDFKRKYKSVCEGVGKGGGVVKPNNLDFHCGGMDNMISGLCQVQFQSL